MCLAAAYTSTEGDEPILQEIAHMWVRSDGVELETLFGERKVVKGKLTEIDFMASKLVIEQ